MDSPAAAAGLQVCAGGTAPSSFIYLKILTVYWMPFEMNGVAGRGCLRLYSKRLHWAHRALFGSLGTCML